MKKIKFLMVVMGLSLGLSTAVMAQTTSVSVSPASAVPGQQVNVTFSVNPSNADLHQIDYVVGFGTGSTPNCNLAWVSPSACDYAKNGVSNPLPYGSVAINPSGFSTVTVTVPVGAKSGSVFVGYTSNCGTVLFSPNNTFCNTTDFWGTAPFTVK